MSFILHTESPSTEDIIDGNSHNNISIKIADTLMRDDVNIVGINGPLGSGKSTVIKLLEKNLPNGNFQFINFDAELYQQGSTKKALITKIYDGLEPNIPNSLKPNLREFKDNALGNNVTYKKTQDSEISTWAILFLFSLFICTQSIRPLQTEWGKPSESMSYFLIGLFTLFLTSPLLLSAIFFIRSLWDNSLKFGNIIKKNSVDTISEKMLVSKEVGSIELHNAIRGFKECIPPGLKFLLIIDNLDRIPSDKVKELWSDIELISNSSEKRLKLLIPYSSEHVAKSLSQDIYEGREFISKRIPISFQIPPILSAGWRNVFSHFWQQSFPSELENLYHDTSELIEIWLPKAYQPITPRYLKKLINDIQITLLSTPYEVRNITCAYYILTTKHNDLPFENLLIDNFESSDLDEKTKDKYKKSIRKLQRIYNNDRKKWIDELLCINFQTNAQLAEGELIDEPLKLALTQYNSEELSRISNMFGFVSAWRRVIDTTDPTDWFITLSKMTSEKSNIIKEILPEVIKALDTMDISGASTLDNENFLPSLNSLKKDGFNIHGLYLSNIQKTISQDLTKYITYDDDRLIELGQNNTEIQQALHHGELLSQLIGYNILNELLTAPKTVFYILNLKDKSLSFKNLEIEQIKLESKDFIDGLQLLFAGGVDFNLTEKNINKHISFESEGIKLVLKEGLQPGLDSIFNNFTSGSIPQNILLFEMMVLTPQWHSANLNTHYTRIINYNIDWKINCLAHWMSHMIASKNIISIESYKQYISTEDDLTYFFSCYLKYISNFTHIFYALTNETLNEYLIPSLNLLANNKMLKINDVNPIVTEFFSVMKKYLSDNFIECFTQDNRSALCDAIENTYIKDIDDSFVDYLVKNTEANELTKSLIESFKGEIDTQDKFNEIVNENYPSYPKILEYSKNNSEHFDFAKDFIFNFYETYKIDAIDRPIPRLIFDTLSHDIKEIAIRELSDLIYVRDLDVRRPLALLKYFSDVLNYSDDESTSGSRAIARLFNQVSTNPEISSWLDRQNINFSKWHISDKQSVVTIIATKAELFPRLKEKGPVKSKIQELSLEND
ncbi:P-loop NTPase fold protein [Enterobacter sp. R4-368]|uniref:P-loop NTPase fold protein n=1 Tax=Enterobacter sp. R4-368 TaxID=1166130 RepID=UPI00034EDFDB|nr:P-loop NTPase fold protein [Enterobacter sp. R4-368]AGN85293.1 hypothetical protein H650_09000 [Enterobacter sp. R4-368]